MIPSFREDKATQAAALLLEWAGGRMNYMKLIKLLYLALRNAEKKWTMVPRFWNSALNQLVIYFPGRLPA